MTVLTEIECPAGAFALRETMATLPDVRFEFERIVASASETVVPLVWATGADDETIRETLAADRDVESVALLARAGDGWLYGIDWAQPTFEFITPLLDVVAILSEGCGTDGWWDCWVLFSDHASLVDAYQRYDDRNVTIDIAAIHELDAISHSRYGLTEKERTALETAYEHGYYEVPHRISTAELGDMLGISHQAVSKRLRRGHGALIEHTLAVGHGGRLGTYTE
ncbi:MAG: helix-turn-helix domain-containing protein [Halorientalis sp.]